jgi:hypothetical protein
MGIGHSLVALPHQSRALNKVEKGNPDVAVGICASVLFVLEMFAGCRFSEIRPQSPRNDTPDQAFSFLYNAYKPPNSRDRARVRPCRSLRHAPERHKRDWKHGAAIEKKGTIVQCIARRAGVAYHRGKYV